MTTQLLNPTDLEYIATCKSILRHGHHKSDRTGTGTISDFGLQMRFDLSKGFPILTTKYVHFKSVVAELLWFLRGETNTDFLKQHGVKIWDNWAVPLSDIPKPYADQYAGEHASPDSAIIGNMYGAKWRNFIDREGQSIDQIKNLIHDLKHNPNSRRHVVSAWDVAELPDETLSPQDNVKNGKPALAPCHHIFQCWVSPDNRLSLLIFQRSADMLIGVPFNVASYSLMAHLLARACNMDVGKLIWVGGDCHIYNNHIDQIQEQIKRFDNLQYHPAPTLWLNPDINDIDDFTMDDIRLENYIHESAIKAPVAI